VLVERHLVRAVRLRAPLAELERQIPAPRRRVLRRLPAPGRVLILELNIEFGYGIRQAPESRGLIGGDAPPLRAALSIALSIVSARILP
jgi:hypothetical protein